MKRYVSIWGLIILSALGLLLFLVYQNQQMLYQFNIDATHNAPIEIPKKEKPRLAIIPYSNQYPSFGSDSAKVKMIAFLDYECPYSMMFIKEQLPLLIDEQVKKGDLKIYFYDRPLKMHRNAFNLSREAHAAYASNNFNEFLNNLGSDIDTSNNSNSAYDQVIEHSIEKAGIAGIVSTPVFVINHRVLSGFRELDELNSLIDYSRNNVIQNSENNNSCSE